MKYNAFFAGLVNPAQNFRKLLENDRADWKDYL